MAHKPRFPLTCAKATRDYFLAQYPGLGNNKAYWRMFVYLLYPHHDDFGRWYIGINAARYIMQSDNSNSIIGFLNNFKRDVVQAFFWNEHTYGTARTIEESGLTDNDESVFAAGIGAMEVYWECGTKWSKAKKAIDNEKDKQYMLEQAMNATHECQRTILEYHANLSPDIYTRLINKNKKYVKDNEFLEKIVKAIYKMPKAIYHTVAKTLRLYPTPGRPNLSSCKRELRRALTVGCYEIDLNNAHLAIIAKEWNVTNLTELLISLAAQGKKAWLYFAECLGVELTPIVKKALKTTIYSLCYGGGVRKIIRNADDMSCIPGFGKRFLSLPIMLDILKARKIAMAYYNYSYEEETGLLDKYTDKEKRSLLSCDSQGIEQELAAEIYVAVAEYADYCSILVNSFDGVTMQIKDNRMVKPILAKVKNAVDAKAKFFGIITTIDAEEVKLDM